MNLFDDEDLDETEEDFTEQIIDEAPAWPDAVLNTELIGHEETEKQFLNWWSENHMPHAVLLSGPKGIGKSTLAYRLARFLLAHPDTPGESLFGAEPIPETLHIPRDDPTFSKVASGGHPDLYTVTKADDKKIITVDEVRGVPGFLRKTASSGGWRVVIVDDANCLNRNAQNALLKILEEPPAKVLLILVTHSIGALIPTIRSRSRTIPMKPLEMDAFETLIKKYAPELSRGDTSLLMQLTDGAPGQAVAYIDQGGMSVVHDVLALLDGLPGAGDGELMIMAEKLAVKTTPDPLTGMLDLSFWDLRRRAKKVAEAGGAGLKNWLDTFDALERHVTMCDRGNLDRRYTAQRALRILQHGMKQAA